MQKEVGTLILTSLLEDLGGGWGEKRRLANTGDAKSRLLLPSPGGLRTQQLWFVQLALRPRATFAEGEAGRLPLQAAKAGGRGARKGESACWLSIDLEFHRFQLGSVGSI